jgi:hypothetical protein
MNENFLKVFVTIEGALEWLANYNLDKDWWQIVDYEGMIIVKCGPPK